MTKKKPRSVKTGTPRPSRPSRRVTVRDVATDAGCSAAVVSMVINRARSSSGASPEMIARVRASAEKLGYRANFASQSLARGSTKTLGVYVPNQPGASLGYGYEGQVIGGFEEACRQREFDLLAINLGGNKSPRHCYEKFSEQRIDGLLLLHLSHSVSWVDDLVRAHPNIVAINYYSSAPQALSTVNYDNQAATALAIEHLIELGHRRIGYVGPYWDAGPEGDARLEGYRQAMADAGLAIDPKWVMTIDDSGSRMIKDDPDFMEKSGDLGMQRLYQLGKDRPSAVVTYNDNIAASVAIGLGEYGIRLGKDFSMVGIDDSPIGRLLRPKLTTVRQPLFEMGKTAAEILLDALTDVRLKPGRTSEQSNHRVAAPELVVRGSTLPLVD